MPRRHDFDHATNGLANTAAVDIGGEPIRYPTLDRWFGNNGFRRHWLALGATRARKFGMPPYRIRDHYSYQGECQRVVEIPYKRGQWQPMWCVRLPARDIPSAAALEWHRAQRPPVFM